MTKRELFHHGELRKQLTAAMELLASLETAEVQKSDGGHPAPGSRNWAGDCAAAIADAKEGIARMEAEIARSESAIVAFVGTIEDLQIRTIFRLRFLGGLAWREVAAAVGGGNTDAGVMIVRFLSIKFPPCFLG